MNVAKAFTGWTMQPRQGSGFMFVAARHDRGDKTVLGQTIKAGGIDEGERVLDIVAGHPATARHIATKLAIRFVSDDPPAALVDRAAARFTATKGDLREVLKVILTSKEFSSPEVHRAKVKTPLEFVASALRATGAEVRTAVPLARTLRDMGMPLYFCQPPTGYDDTAATWVSAGALVSRMNFAVDLSQERGARRTRAAQPRNRRSRWRSARPSFNGNEGAEKHQGRRRHRRYATHILVATRPRARTGVLLTTGLSPKRRNGAAHPRLRAVVRLADRGRIGRAPEAPDRRVPARRR